MKKHFLFLLVAIVASVGNLLAYDFEADGLYYRIISDKENEVALTFESVDYDYSWDYDGCYNLNKSLYPTIVNIPSTVVHNETTYNVTCIGSHAFANWWMLTSVTIPNSVTSIEHYAFYGCSGLTSVTISNSVTSIDDYAFDNCSFLANVTIPNSVTSIGENAFSGVKIIIYSGTATGSPWGAIRCEHGYIDGWLVYRDETKTELISCLPEATGEISIPESVTAIEDYAFNGRSGLTSVVIPNSVTSIGQYAFYGCSGLKRVTLNSNAIVGKAYTYESSLKDIFGSQVTEYIIGNDVTSIGNYAFCSCYGLTSVTIGNSVTSIDNYAFYGCSSLTSVTIPNSVTSIGSGAFYDCFGLTSITIPNSITSIGDGAFSGCSGLTTPVYNSYVFAYMPITYSGAFVIPSGIESVVGGAFSGCSGLTSVTIPNSVTSIGGGAFESCSGLTSITIPNSVTSIDNYAFYGCSSLTSITIPNSVTSIGNYAFSGCSGLTSVTIPSSVINIGDNAFSVCSSLTSVTIGNSVTSIGNYAFSVCSSLTSVTIPNSVTSIGNDAFEYCSSLTSITIGNSVTSIGEAAFYDCTSLTSVHISDLAAWCGIVFSNADSNPLYYAKHLYLNDIEITDLVIPESVISIGNFAFCSCTSLTNLSIPSSVTIIGYSAFDGCTGLTSVTIPNSITSIGDGAFYGVSNIVYYGEATGSPWGARNMNCYVEGWLVYSDESKTTLLACSSSSSGDLIIPNSVTSIGSGAFYDCSGLTSITIPNSITSIGNYAFSGCSGLTSVTIPSSVISIGDNAFYNCSALASIIVPCQDEERFLQLLDNDQRIKRIKTIIEYSNLINLLSDKERGGISIDEEPNSCDSLITFSAVPNNGYSFVKWSDGNTEAQRKIKLTEESQTFGAIFHCETLDLSYLATGGSDFGEMTTDNSNVWSYNSQYGAYGSKSGGVSGNLFTPAKDLSMAESITLSFQHAHKFAGTPSEEFTLWVTKDFKGSWDDSEWQQLTISPYTNNTSWAFVSVTMNVPTAYVGKNTVFAFRYKSTASNYGTWEIKNLKITVVGRDQYEIVDMSDQTQGHIVGSGLYDYLSTVELNATPNYGYHFVQWSDGVTDNTRTVVLHQDTAFAAEFAFDKSGTCGDDNLLTWKYDAEAKLLTISGEGALNSNYTYGVEAPTQVESLIIGSGVTSIGDEAFKGFSTLKSVELSSTVTTIGNSAFENCSSLEELSLGENITKYGEKAFAGCEALTSIYNYRSRPAKLGTDAFKDVDYFNCTLYVLAGSVDMYKSSGSDWKDFYFIEPISAESASADEVVVVPHDNSADISWPKVAEAETYELKITKDGEVFCVLVFNTQGQLVSIAFAPSRYNAAEQAQAAGFSFTITGLSSGTRYGYNVTASNSTEEALDSKSGIFMTTTDGKVSTFDVTFVVKDNPALQYTIADVPFGTTIGSLIEVAKEAVGGESFEDEMYVYTFAGVENTELTDIVTESTTYYILYTKTEKTPTSVSNAETSTAPLKLLRDGQLFILREGKMYDVTGLEVR